MTYYAIAYVPIAARSAAESAIAPYLLGSGDIWTVPLCSGPDYDEITHYGCCAPVSSDGQLIAALPSLAASIPGSGYHVVNADLYSVATDWTEWLDDRALSVFVEAP